MSDCCKCTCESGLTLKVVYVDGQVSYLYVPVNETVSLEDVARLSFEL
jgi:hypothetical protein